MKFPLVLRKRFTRLKEQNREMRDRLAAATSEYEQAVLASRSAPEMFVGLAKTLDYAGLYPIGVCRSQAEWIEFQAGRELRSATAQDNRAIFHHRFDQEWTLAGYSVPAESFVEFQVDMQFGGRETEAGYVPNIRERLICPVTNLNNRQRLVADLVAMRLNERTDSENVYVMEQVTPFYKWLTARHGRHNIVGSEYLGDDLAKGAIINEIRHEDIQALSFEDNSIDFVISNEVMEHVPSPARAFSEVARVMRPGAEAIMTFPFFVDRPQSQCRAELRNGKIVHHHEPQYHGNPISSDGSLVFTDFGWDILEVIKNAGFGDVVVEIYHSAILGHLGAGLLVFRMTK